MSRKDKEARRAAAIKLAQEAKSDAAPVVGAAFEAWGARAAELEARDKAKDSKSSGGVSSGSVPPLPGLVYTPSSSAPQAEPAYASDEDEDDLDDSDDAIGLDPDDDGD